jgi:hypothetical protein
MKRFISALVCIVIICLAITGCKKDETVVETKQGVDIDLTQMSLTMVQATMTNILNQPGQYLGQTIKLTATHFLMYDDRTDRTFHLAIVGVEDACCAIPIEFRTVNGDYPADEAFMEIIGTFSSYEDDGFRYLYISASEITILQWNREAVRPEHNQ